MKVIDQTLLEKVIIERCRHSHKGDYGRLLLLGGTYPYGGAIIMSAIAAVKSGAGLVTVGTDKENIPALHSHLPEAMAFSLQDQQLLKEQLEKAEVVLLGPGLREDAFGEELVKRVFDSLRKDQILIYVTISPSRSARCETNKPPAMRVRIEGYTKKLQTRYNKGVQANCKAKGEKYGTKGT